MRILVLGAYGLIGQEIARRLSATGHEVTGLGRSARLGRRLMPGIGWIEADLARMRAPADWVAHIEGFDAIVNAAGALQDGAKDDVAAVQQHAIVALIAACEAAKVGRFVQISAPGVAPDSDTPFMRTKAIADAALRASRLDWTILRPGLVIGPNAYGGTVLLRMLAAIPFAQILVLGNRTVRIVGLGEVAQAVLDAIAGAIPSRQSFDLVSSERYRLSEVVTQMRAWLGLPPARFSLLLPDGVGFALARLADLTGWAGWRSPLRSTALKVLARGIDGDPEPWAEATGRRLPGLEETLATMPATRQERSFAKTQLVFPLLVGTLVTFWLVSGLIGLWQLREAMVVLPGWIPPWVAAALVIGGAVIDIAIGIGFLLRRLLPAAAVASIAVSLSYLAAATWLTPGLWADPLGPLVKIFPAMALALAVLAQSDER